MFHSLLKAHAVEARSVVRQALEILTPAMPQRMEDGNTMLTHWTKKIIVEDGHSVQQLFHILQLVVRHYKVGFKLIDVKIWGPFHCVKIKDPIIYLAIIY